MARKGIEPLKKPSLTKLRFFLTLCNVKHMFHGNWRDSNPGSLIDLIILNDNVVPTRQVNSIGIDHLI